MLLTCSQCEKKFKSKKYATVCSDKCKKTQEKNIIKWKKQMISKGWVFSTCSKCKEEIIYNCKLNCNIGCMAYSCPNCNYINCKTPLKYYKVNYSTWFKKITKHLEGQKNE